MFHNNTQPYIAAAMTEMLNQLHSVTEGSSMGLKILANSIETTGADIAAIATKKFLADSTLKNRETKFMSKKLKR
jgi:hypothetical protein